MMNRIVHNASVSIIDRSMPPRHLLRAVHRVFQADYRESGGSARGRRFLLPSQTAGYGAFFGLAIGLQTVSRLVQQGLIQTK
jgi:hypothetical protein